MRAHIGIVVAAALALVAGGCFGEDRPQVSTERVRAGVVTQTVSAPARVDAAARQDVAAAVSGTVVTVEVADGEAVDAGQVVLRLHSEQLEAARRQAEAAQTAAASGAAVRVAGGGRATLDAVHEAVRQLDASVQAPLGEARTRAASVSDPEQRAAVDAAIAAAEAAYLATRTGLLTTGQAVAAQQDASAAAVTDALNQAIRQASAPQRAQAEAALAAAEAQAADLAAAAPFAGTVQLGTAAASDGAGVALPPGLPPEVADALPGAIGAGGGSSRGGTLRPGAPVAAGQVLFTVFDLSTWYVNADVDEFDAPQVAIGQRADITVDAFPDVDLEGVVEGVRVEAASTEAGGLGFPTRIRVIGPREPGPAGDAAMAGLRVGMTAGVDIVTRTEEAAMVVPSRALLRRDGGDIVFVVRDGLAVAVPVTVTTLGEDAAAVAGDLHDHDRVVVGGYEGLESGDSVRT